MKNNLTKPNYFERDAKAGRQFFANEEDYQFFSTESDSVELSIELETEE